MSLDSHYRHDRLVVLPRKVQTSSVVNHKKTGALLTTKNVPKPLDVMKEFIQILPLLFCTLHGYERLVVGEHETLGHVGAPVSSQPRQGWLILPYIVFYELVPGLASLNISILLSILKLVNGPFEDKPTV